MTLPPSDFDLMLDCYLTWQAYIELCRKRYQETGEYPPTGPWRPRDADEAMT